MVEGGWPISLSVMRGVVGGARLWRTHGQLRGTVVIKATFGLRQDKRMEWVSPDPVVVMDEHLDGSPDRSLRAASELAPYLPRTDVLFKGNAHAPADDTSEMSVRLAIRGSRPLLDKSLTIYGDRTAPAEGEPAPAPRPFDWMPITYERTHRGAGFDENPAGIVVVPGAPMPNIIDPSDPDGPAGFGPLAGTWPFRRRLLRSLDPATLSAPVPELPDAFAWSFFHASPPDQRCPFLEGDEWVVLENLHPVLPRLETQLPGAKAGARVYGLPDEAPFLELTVVADMLTIDAERDTCSLLWRGNFPIPDEAVLPKVRVLLGLELPGMPIPWPEPEAAQVRPSLSQEMPAVRPGGANAELEGAPEDDTRQRQRKPSLDLDPPMSAPTIPEMTMPPVVDDVDDEDDQATILRAPGLRVAAPSVPEQRFAEASPPSGRQMGPPPVTGPLIAAAPPGDRPAVERESPSARSPLEEADPEATEIANRSVVQALVRKSLVEEPTGAGASPAPKGPHAIEDPPTVAADDDAIAELLAAAESLVEAGAVAIVATAPTELAMPAAAPAAGPISSRISREEALAGRRTLAARIEAGQSLEGLHLAGADLSDMDLRGKKLTGCDLRKARLCKTHLERCDLTGTNLSQADLTAAHLDEAILERTDLYGAVVSDASFARAKLTDSNFSTATGERACFDDATGERALFGNGSFASARFERVKLQNADFTEAVLDGARFNDADLSELRMYEADARGAIFDQATLSGARFDSANLEGSSLQRIYAPDSVWDQSSLDDASFLGAMLPGASFIRASCRRTVFSEAELAEARLKRARLEGAKFVKTDVSMATFEGADLRGAALPPTMIIDVS